MFIITQTRTPVTSTRVSVNELYDELSIGTFAISVVGSRLIDMSVITAASTEEYFYRLFF